MRHSEENSATEIHERWRSLALQGEWERVRELLADGIVRTDKRSMGAPPLSGPDDLIAAAKETLGVGFHSFTSTTVETRGDSLGLIETSIVSESGFRMDYLLLVALDRQDRLTKFVMYDLSDSESAFDDLDRLHAEIETEDSSRPSRPRRSPRRRRRARRARYAARLTSGWRSAREPRPGVDDDE